MLSFSFGEGVFQCRPIQNTDDAIVVHNRPGTELAGASSFERIMDAQLCRKNLRGLTHQP